MSELSKEELLDWLYKNLTPSCGKLPWKNENREAYSHIVALIKKEVTEEWIGEKVKEMEQVTIPIESRKKDRENFIRSLVEEIQGENDES